MWIPYRLYEALPRICVSIGGLVLALALYLGFDNRSLLFYLFVAFGCMVYGASIMWLRYRYRRPPPAPVTDGEDPMVSMARRFH
jgi:hypothetical protein